MSNFREDWYFYVIIVTFPPRTFLPATSPEKCSFPPFKYFLVAKNPKFLHVAKIFFWRCKYGKEWGDTFSNLMHKWKCSTLLKLYNCSTLLMSVSRSKEWAWITISLKPSIDEEKKNDFGRRQQMTESFCEIKPNVVFKAEIWNLILLKIEILKIPTFHCGCDTVAKPRIIIT